MSNNPHAHQMTPRFEIFPTPNTDSFEEDLHLIRLSDELGLDLVGMKERLFYPIEARVGAKHFGDYYRAVFLLIVL